MNNQEGISTMDGTDKNAIEEFINANKESNDRNLIASLAKTAGNLARNMQGSKLEVIEKTNKVDLVTNADIIIENFLVEVLNKLRPRDGILGEEQVGIRSKSGRYWVIDPIDGTFNYTNKLDHYCSAVALIEGDPYSDPDVLQSAVFRPMSEELWVGGCNNQSTLNGTILNKPKSEMNTLVTYLHPCYLEDNNFLNAWRDLAQNFSNVRMLGSSSLDLALVAQSTFDVWLQRDTKPWDWLPGKGIIQGTGQSAEVIQLDNHRWYVAGGRQTIDIIARYFAN